MFHVIHFIVVICFRSVSTAAWQPARFQPCLPVSAGFLRQSQPTHRQTKYILRRVPDASASCSSVSAWGVWRIQSPYAASPSFLCRSCTPDGYRSRFPRFPISSHGISGSSGVSVPRQKLLRRVVLVASTSLPCCPTAVLSRDRSHKSVRHSTQYPGTNQGNR